MQLVLVLCILGLLSLSEQSKRARISAPGTNSERDAKKRRTEVSSKTVIAHINELQCQFLELENSHGYIGRDEKRKVMKAMHEMWLKIPSGTKYQLVGLSTQGQFEILPAVPEIFSRGDPQRTPTDVFSIFPATVKFDVLISRLQNYIKQANHSTLSRLTGKSPIDNPAEVLEFFVEKVPIQDRERNEVSDLLAGIWDNIIYHAMNPEAIRKMENALLSGKTDDITIYQFVCWLKEDSCLEDAVKTVAPYLIEKHVPFLYRKRTKDEIGMEDEVGWLTGLSLEEKLLLCPVILAEGRAMLEFVHHATMAAGFPEINNNDRSAALNASERVLKDIVPYIKSPNSTARTIDLFLLQAASMLLNDGKAATDDVVMAADALNEIYQTLVKV